ncbi:glycoside hydrolase family 2 TIM barrel-domain containing protein, partial [Bacteroidota bacterium]
MKYFFIFNLFIILISACTLTNNDGVRKEILLDADWQFYNDEVEGGEKPETSTANWETVSVPHDWAISGDFDVLIDAQETRVIEDGERVSRIRTGRTGGLPHIGIGWYRKVLEIPASYKNKIVHIEFDGAMSHARLYMNGEFVGEWPFGYSSFGFDLTRYIKFGEDNILAVRLENKPLTSRWYPGAGIYRNVRLVITNPVFVKQWGTYVTTPDIQDGEGTVSIETNILNKSNDLKNITVETQILSPEGGVVETVASEIQIAEEAKVKQELNLNSPILWSPESPILYTAVTRILENDILVDTYKTPFGFRYFKFTNDDGFHLNGSRLQLNGVCLHHDLGPLGAAVNLSSLRHRMKLLQEMGCNSIRTSHNPPAPEMLDLADEMGFLIMDEAFDEWKHGKVENGYNKLWDEWAEKDLQALIHRDRNHPSVIMWSIGNEIREQHLENGKEYAQFLVDICKREDPTRPTTAGFNSPDQAIKNGLAESVDVPGWNYKPGDYKTLHEKLPHLKIIASETASTVSSRGEYFFPVEERNSYTREPHHS